MKLTSLHRNESPKSYIPFPSLSSIDQTHIAVSKSSPKEMGQILFLPPLPPPFHLPSHSSLNLYSILRNSIVYQNHTIINRTIHQPRNQTADQQQQIRVVSTNVRFKMLVESGSRSRCGVRGLVVVGGGFEVIGAGVGMGDDCFGGGGGVGGSG